MEFGFMLIRINMENQLDIQGNAAQIIRVLEKKFINDEFQFNFQVSFYLQGADKKRLRKEVMRQLRGLIEIKGNFDVPEITRELMAKYNQPVLF